MDDSFELRDGRWRFVVAPSLGGSLALCEYDGVAVLQPTAQPAGAGRPAMHCCYFPLIPFSNRIANGRFAFNGSSIQLGRNVTGSPHALHGHGWQSAWQVTERETASCTLSFQRASAPDWPWPYRGQQTVAIHGDALSFTLSVANLGAGVMPCGLGFHPFLPKSADARLTFEAARVWNGSAADFPSELVTVAGACDFHSGPRVTERVGTDHCFEGWRGRATVGYESLERRLRLEACEAARYLMVYIPANADYFCIEPVTHAVNAMNQADIAQSGIWMLKPGETRHITMTLRLDGFTRRD